MATVASCAPEVHSAGAISPVAWQALSYVAGKESDRDALQAGATHTVDLILAGRIDGRPIEALAISGRLNVGQDSVRASSSVPNCSQVLGWILGKLNQATREAVLRDLPAEFAGNGSSLPEVASGLVAQAEGLMAALRSTKQTAVRGSVKVEYAVVPAASIFGLVG